MNLRTLLNEATQRLERAGIDAPRLSAQVLAAHCLACSKLDLLMRAEHPLTQAEAAYITAAVDRRAAGEPVAYITGVKEFYGRDFTVTPATLIPRPETEHVVEAALAGCPTGPQLFADLGTGSGCIGVTLVAERPAWRGCLVDISFAALTAAETNAATHGVQDRTHMVRGDLCAPPLASRLFDLVVSNPPYVTGAEYATLSQEVRNFEPQTALTPDPTGLTHIHALAREAARILRPGGLCLVEHGFAQGQAAMRIFADAGFWDEIEIIKDFAGLDRICRCRRV